jgi:predicted nucleic acid-binding protein
MLETYSVLTRMPPPRRVAPQLAESAIRGLLEDAILVGLTPTQVLGLLTDLAGADERGGAVYDALIIESAIQAGVDEVVTFNVRDFERLARARITVTRPALQ